MSLEEIALVGIGVKWLWEQYGKIVTDKAIGELKKKWSDFHWKEAEEKYRSHIYDQYKTTRILGNPKPIVVEDTYIDVYVTTNIATSQIYDINELPRFPAEHDSFHINNQTRISALDAIKKYSRLFILGKPGAGKTTFLKYLTLQTCKGSILKTPIFISLMEWAETHLEIIPFLVKQFEICNFPDAGVFIKNILDNGNALVLFDGLDEVKKEDNQRSQMIQKIVDFIKHYTKNQICLTCRPATTDYSFEQLTYLEIADFNDPQIRQFVVKWYQNEESKQKQFFNEFNKPENKRLHELARTPLLLTLLLLAFDETLCFPSRKIDLYKEGVDALLKKWSTSRNIRRDEIYRGLSPRRKEQMLARLAAQNFESRKYFVRKDTLVKQIDYYLSQLPKSDIKGEPDGEAVLKAIEEQHGLLVECAKGMYSFSHLTFQEYFTAHYIVDNASMGTIKKLIHNHMNDKEWDEIFLLTASLLDTADEFFEIFLNEISRLIQEDSQCVEIMNFVNKKSSKSKWKNKNGVRATLLLTGLYNICFFGFQFKNYPGIDNVDDFYILRTLGYAENLAISFASDHASDIAKTTKQAQSVMRNKDHLTINNRKKELLKLIAALDLGIDFKVDSFRRIWNLNTKQIVLFNKYLLSNILLTKCLLLGAVTNRADIENKLLVLSKV